MDQLGGSEAENTLNKQAEAMEIMTSNDINPLTSVQC